ncbi:MAG: CRISPR-associated endonuclease Cas2 [Armatimonadetes bacterium]|nr:MAG: CRISPR-associated endonuclease Cas2 [Armatimonadota bacterium]
MKWLVCYDIEKDSVRNKVADFCLDKGLERVQYSVFLGSMTRTLAKELGAQIRKRMGKNPGQVRFVPICEKDWRSSFRVQVGDHMGEKSSDDK